MITQETPPSADQIGEPAAPTRVEQILSYVRRKFLPPAQFAYLTKQLDRLLILLGLMPFWNIKAPPKSLDHDVVSLEHDRPDRCPIKNLDADEEANKPEGRILVLTGETGAGKTRAIKRLLRQRQDQLEDVLVSVVAPSPCTLMQLGRKLLPLLGYPIQRDRKEHLIWEEVRCRIDIFGIRVLHIDEMQHVIQTANSDQQKRILNTIKSLIQDRSKPMLLILSGTCELADFLRTDGQVRRRCRFVEFTRLTIPGDVDVVADTLEDLAEAASLELAPTSVEDLAARLIHAANYALGVAMEIACDAIEEAVFEDDSKLLPSHFAEVYRSRSGCSNAANPFLVANWQETDPEQVLDRPRMEVEPPMPKTSKAPRPAGRNTKKTGKPK